MAKNISVAQVTFKSWQDTKIPDSARNPTSRANVKALQNYKFDSQLVS